MDKVNDALGAVNRGNRLESGLCSLYRADCQGRCETWLSSMRGRKMLYPRDFGTITAGSGNNTQVGVSYAALCIQGYNYGAQGLPKGLSHSRLGYTEQASAEQVREDFMESVSYLRSIGFKRISLKTGSYGMEALAMAIKFATDAKLDLLTIDGSGGGTGMSPWNMMETWGVPSILLHSKAHEYASVLAAKGQRVADMAFGGGLAREDHMFKALALGAPFVKLICMGRGIMIPGFLGANIEGALHPERKKAVCGNWEGLPAIFQEIGGSAEEIFAGYQDVQKKVGKDAMKSIPHGAIAMWTCADKLNAGLQQLMAGARKFSTADITRDDIVAANRETQRETRLQFITEALDAQAYKVLNA